MKTYLLLWNENNKLELNVFNTYKQARWYKKKIKQINKNSKPKIVKVGFPVLGW